MPRGVDITGQGVKFLVQMDMSQALKMLKDFEQRFQNSERAVDTLSQQMQSQFGRLSNAMSEYIEDLNREPNMVSPGGATSRQVEGMKKVQRLVEEMGRTMSTELRKANDGGRSLSNTVDTLGNTLKRTNDESRQLEKNLGELAEMGNAFKSALAFTGLSLGIGAIVHETIEWDKVLTKLELRLKSVGGEYTAIHADIMKLSRETGGAAEEIAGLNTELLQMGVSSRSAQRQIVTIAEQMGQMFDVDKSGMARFFAQLSNLGLAGEKDMKKLADTMAHLASDPNSGPGSTDQDIAAVQSRMGEIQKLRSYLRSEGRLTEDQLNDTTNTMMAQIMLVNRKLSKLGIDPEILTNMLRLPGQISEEGGTRALGFLSSGFSQLGMQVNPAELMNEIKKGHIDKAMTVFDQAVAQMAKDPKLIEMVPNEFLQLLMGNLAGGDSKQLVAALENARAAGHGLTKELIASVTALAKAHAEGSALDRLWARYKESLGKSWDDMVSTMGRVGKQLGIILAGPMKGMVDMVKWVAMGFERFLIMVQHSNTALRTMQAVFITLAGTAIGAVIRASQMVLKIWQSTAGFVGVAVNGARNAAPVVAAPASTAAGAAAGAAATGATLAGAAVAETPRVRGVSGAAQSIANAAAATYASPGVMPAVAEVSRMAATAQTFMSGVTRLTGSLVGKAILGVGALQHGVENYSRVKEETGNTTQATGAAIGAGAGFVGGALAGAGVGAFGGAFAPLTIPVGMAVGGTIGALGGAGIGQSAAALISPDDMAAAAAKGTRQGTVEGMEAAADKLAGAVGEGLADAEQRNADEQRFGPGSDTPQTELGKKMQAVYDASQQAFESYQQAYGSPLPLNKRYVDKTATDRPYSEVPPEMQQTQGQAAAATTAPLRAAQSEGNLKGLTASMSEDAARQAADYSRRQAAAQASAEAELERQHAQALRDQELERSAAVAAQMGATTDPQVMENIRRADEEKQRTAQETIDKAEKAAAESKAKAERLAAIAAGQAVPEVPTATAAQDASGAPAVAPPAATAGPAPTPVPPAATPPPQVTVNVDQSEVVDALKTLPGAFVDGFKQIQNMERARRAGGMGTEFEQ